MKNLLLIISLFIASYTLSFGQQSLYLPVGIMDNRVDIGDLDIAGEFITVEAIITEQTSTGNINNIVCKHISPYDANYTLRSSEFLLRTTAGFISLPNPIVLCADSTYHVAGTYDGDSLKYYVNGVEVASVHWTGDLFLNNNITSIGDMWYNGGLNEQYYGYIDEVRIWNVARTETEIASNMYNLPNPTTQSGLLAYYQFNGNYNNVQGNSAWDGTPIGTEISIASNPLFNGSVSSNFCNPIGIFEYSNSFEFSIYPNPTKGNFTIDIPRISSEDFTLTISNLVGQKLQVDKLTDEKSIINFKQPDGIYFLTISTAKESYSKIIIVQQD